MSPLEVLTPGEVGQGDDEMAEQIAEPANVMVALTALADEAGAAAAARIRASDQLSQDSQRMWSIAMTSPTVMAAHGMRIAAEMGSGRTRAETNLPAATSAAGNAGGSDDARGSDLASM